MHPSATTSTDAQPDNTERLLAPFVRQWAILLKTQKRDGRWVAAPVNVAVDGNCAYIGTPANTVKVKRLHNRPNVEVEPCTPRGQPTGPTVLARARLLEGDEAKAAARLLRRKYRLVYGVLVPLELRIRRTFGRYYELTSFRPANPPGSSSGFTARS